MLADCYDALENVEHKALSSVTANVIVRWEDSEMTLERCGRGRKRRGSRLSHRQATPRAKIKELMDNGCSLGPVSSFLVLQRVRPQ
jgi:hypothetical protein